MRRHSILKLGSAAVAGMTLMLASGFSMSQSEFPSSTITLIVPTNPGGSIDSVARIVGERIENTLKQSVVVENRVGAGGMIAASTVSRAAPDGHTLLVTHTGVLQADLLRKNPTYRLEDLVPVAEVSNTPVAFGIGVDVPATDLESFIELARQKPESLSYGSYGIGSSAHIWAEQFTQAARIKLMHVPYGGEMPALQDVLSGNITGGWGAVGTYKQQADANKIRILAIANPEPSILMPDIPTFIDAGFPEMNASGWTGIFAPKGTPDSVVRKISETIVDVVNDPDTSSRILKTGQEPTGRSHVDFSARVLSDRQTWADAISEFNITLE